MLDLRLLDALVEDGEVERFELGREEDYFLEGGDGVESSLSKYVRLLVVGCEDIHHEPRIGEVDSAAAHSVGFPFDWAHREEVIGLFYFGD